MGPSWRPFWLRPVVLSSFGVIFLLLAVSFEMLLWTSDRNNGLVTSRPELEYIWTYIPTAVATALAAAWFRVVFQAQETAPWRRLLSGLPIKAEDSVLLDYTSMSQPKALLKALKIRDWAVILSVMGSLFLQLVVVLSTKLFSLTWTEVELKHHPIILETEFQRNSSNLTTAGTIDYYTVSGLFSGGLSYPAGTTNEFAYQSIYSQDSINTELRATVDGFVADLECKDASISLDSWEVAYEHRGSDYINVTVASQDCLLKTYFNVSFMAWLGDQPLSQTSEINNAVHFSRQLIGHCNNNIDDLDDGRIVFISGLVNYTSRLAIDGMNVKAVPDSIRLVRSAQAVCKMIYRTPRLNIVQNGTTAPSVSQATYPPANQGLNLHPWSIMEALMSSIPRLLTMGFEHVIVDKVAVDVDRFALNLLRSGVPVTVESLYQNRFLMDLISRYYKTFAAQLVARSLMQPVSIESTGSAKTNTYRLSINRTTCRTLTVLFSLLTVICLISSNFKPQVSAFPYSLSRILGLAATYNTWGGIINDSISILSRLNDKEFRTEILATDKLFGDKSIAGKASNRAIGAQRRATQQQIDPRTILARQQFRLNNTCPAFLRPISTYSVAAFLGSLILLIELMLHKSLLHEGLGSVDSDDILHYGITISFALAFGILALCLRSIDFELRTLAPYQSMKGLAVPKASINLDLLNKTVPRIILSEIRSSSYYSLAATITTLLASLLTIFLNPMFQATKESNNSAVQLPSMASLYDPHVNSTNEKAPSLPQVTLEGLTSSLILRKNLSYPQFTYENLAFLPTAFENQAGDTDGSNFQDGDLGRVHATLPAVRTNLTCTPYSLSIVRCDPCDLETQYDPFRGAWDCLNGPDINSVTDMNRAIVGLNRSEHIFGRTASTDYCGHYFTWGRIERTSEGGVKLNAASIYCNETAEMLDLHTTFTSPNLLIDPAYPPQPDELSTRGSTMRYRKIFDDIQDMGLLSESTQPTLFKRIRQFDPFFELLITSPYALPLSDLGDLSKFDKVVSAISFQHGLIQAQAARLYMRGEEAYSPLDTNATVIRNLIEKMNNTDPYAAEVEVTRHRLVQNPVVSRILEALLGTILLLHLLRHFLGPRPNILPRSPRSIASGLAFIAGGNLFDFLTAERIKDVEDLDQFARNEIFNGRVAWLGWKECRDAQGQLAARYGIWILTPEEVAEAKDRQEREQEALKNQQEGEAEDHGLAARLRRFRLRGLR